MSNNSRSEELLKSDKPASKGIGLWLKLLAVFAVLLMLITMSVAFLFMMGAVYGVEFCPDDFSTRNFSYYEIPFTGRQMTGVSHSPYAGSEMSDAIIRDGYLTAAPKPKTWHLLQDNRTPEDSIATDSRLLYDLLQQVDENYSLKWEQWGLDHPQQAKVFWPCVSDLAKAYLYIDAHKLFDFIAKNSFTPKTDPATQKKALAKFDKQLKKLMAEIFFSRGKDAVALNNDQDAKLYLEKAIEYGHDEIEANTLLKDLE